MDQNSLNTKENLDYCQNPHCKQKIEIQIFKHTGQCSILCEKVIKGEYTQEQAEVVRRRSIPNPLS